MSIWSACIDKCAHLPQAKTMKSEEGAFARSVLQIELQIYVNYFFSLYLSIYIYIYIYICLCLRALLEGRTKL